jgi:hypothetical protein
MSEWAEALYQEGEMKCILNRGLCGMAHLVPAVRGKMPGTWRLYHAWSKSESRRQAPPVERLLAQAFAGYFASRALPRTAVVILAAHDCIMRNAEFYELRKGDVIPAGKHALLSLRDTKMGQRLGVTQQVLCDSPWLAARIVAAARATQPGELIMDSSAVKFRQVWAQARKVLGVKDCTTPYGLRRGGATTWFRCTGSFDKVCDKGRWSSLGACRIYVTSALQAAAEQEHADMTTKWETWASHLWKLP